MSTPVYMHTLGCPKNRVDSEVMLGTLTEAGYRLVQDPAKAEVIVVNTCGFLQAAAEESVDTILELAEQKRSGRCKKLIVAGCLTQRYHGDLPKELPEVDHFVGTGAYQDIAKIVADAQAKRVIVPDPDFVHNANTPRQSSLPGHTAYLKISEGCDNECGFCIIPALRGPQRSREIADVVAEAEHLASLGAVELSLVAQDLTAYGYDLPGKKRLADLLRELSKVDVRWLRLHYAYPRDFPDALIELIASEPRIVKYLDMPVQHSSDRLLRSMKRGRDSKFLRELLGKLRARVPGIALRTTLIVGLPGETDEDFDDLVRFVTEQRFERLGVFQYSPEDGTPAATMEGQVPAEVKQARFDRVMSLQQTIARELQESLVGKRIEVLVEGPSEETEHLLVGRSSQQAPEIDGVTYVTDGVAYPGEIVTVEITQAHDYDLAGPIVGRDASRAKKRLPPAKPSPMGMGGRKSLKIVD
jgi:ribosomal protein S12 methylthiotransferase